MLYYIFMYCKAIHWGNAIHIRTSGQTFEKIKTESLQGFSFIFYQSKLMNAIIMILINYTHDEDTHKMPETKHSLKAII